ncbi:MAG: flagellar biosynthesis anti-sigma factor FlgM [Clostridiales bacterium]|jgi:flagellar biosynthesis anti-sigma factor FlgM|nr:flagellar biosynthesis anti-sigma factor FlgM [Clostridiales bacterium]
MILRGVVALNIVGANIFRVLDICANSGTTAAPRISRAEETRDTAELSMRAKEFYAAKKAIDAAPDVRLDMVNAVARRIEAGSYGVSAEMVADKIIAGAARDVH